MVLTKSQEQKRYRQNLNVRGLCHEIKADHTEQMIIHCQSLTGKRKQDYDKKHAESQRTYRNKKNVEVCSIMFRNT